MSGGVTLGVADAHGIRTATLEHAGKLNAMSRGMWAQLQAAFDEAQRDGSARCILLRGAGGAFCAGGDIAEYPDFRFDEAALRRFHEEAVWGGLQAVLACDLPVVCAIDGACMGAGLEIAACCDLRIAAAGARFGAPIGRLGFPMAPRETALLLRTAGDATVRQLLLGGAVLDAATLAARGFLHAVLPDGEDVHAAAHALAVRAASLAPAAARRNKATLRALATAFDAAADPALHPDTAYAYAASAEHREGIAAFLAKRAPAFTTP